MHIPFLILNFLGNEEYGISDEILKEVDHIVQIPMLGKKNSINVVAAFSICTFQIAKTFFKQS